MGDIENQHWGMFVPKRTLALDDFMRAAVAKASGQLYQSLPTLEAARAAEDGVVILQGDDGGTIYVVCPAAHVRCDLDDLSRLLLDLDAVQWGQPGMTRLCFECHQIGAVIPGGMGGGRVTPGVWTHHRLLEKGLGSAIEAVLSGQSKGVQDGAEYAVAHNEFRSRREMHLLRAKLKALM